MKKLLFLALLLGQVSAFSQLKFNDAEYLTLQVSANPISVFDKAQNFTTLEVEYNAPRVYVRATIKTMQGQDYFDWGGAMGTALENNKVRIYTGFKIATTIVDGKHYALTGLESGLDLKSCNKLTLGLRVTFDYVAHYDNYLQPCVVLKYRL